MLWIRGMRVVLPLRSHGSSSCSVISLSNSERGLLTLAEPLVRHSPEKVRKSNLLTTADLGRKRDLLRPLRNKINE